MLNIVFVCLLGAQDAADLDRWIRDLSAKSKPARDKAEGELRGAAPRCWKELEERAAAQPDVKIRDLVAAIAAQGKRRDPERIAAAVAEIVAERKWKSQFPLPGFFEKFLRAELTARELELTPESISRALLKACALLLPADAPDALLGSLANSLGSTAVEVTRADAREALKELLKLPRPIVQASAIDSLVSLGASDESGLFREHARQGALLVRLRAVSALAALNPDGAAETLEGLMADDEAQIRKAALIALGSLSPPAAAKAVPAALKDPAADVRETALDIARTDRPADLLPAVAALVGDPEPALRAAALRYLGKTPGHLHADKVSARLKDEDPRVRRAAVLAAAVSGLRDLAKPIEALLRDRDRSVVDAAIQALWVLGAKESADAIARTARNNTYRAGAYVALARLGAERHLATLVTAAKAQDEEVAVRGILAVGEMRVKSAAPELVGLIDAKRPQASVAAVYSLARLRHADVPAETLDAASKISQREMQAALDAYLILAQGARDSARVLQLFRGRDERRGWSAQLQLHELRYGDEHVRAVRRFFDPEARSVRALLEEIRRQLGLKVEFSLPAEALAQPLAATYPMTLEDALNAVAAALGGRLCLSLEGDSLRLQPVDRASAMWSDWLTRRGQ